MKINNVTGIIVEKRFITKDKIEIRENDNKEKVIEGYTIKWEELSEELGWWYTFREKFKKGAFKEYLNDSKNDTKALLNHDTTKVLGRTKYNTVEVFEDNVGLRYSLKVPNTTLGNDLYESVSRGDIDGTSVGFRMLIQQFDEEQKPPIRTIIKAELPEFSFTAFPAYDSTTTNIRNINNDNNPYLKYLNKRRQKVLNEFKRYNEINKLKSKI